MSVQDSINQLLWDRRYVTIPDEVERPHGLDDVIIHDLSIEDRNFYLFIKDREERIAKQAGVPSEELVMQSARVSEYWTSEDDEILTKADDHIAFLESEFEAKKKFKSRQNIIKLQIADAQAKKHHVYLKQLHLRASSAEYLAHETACFALVRRLVFTIEEKPLFPDEESFLFFKHHYMPLLYFFVKEITSEGLPSTETIRSIARSPDWRLLWVLNRENLEGLFGRTVSNFSIRHKMLIYWSRIYDSAIESTDPPALEVIQDDKMFDQWLVDKDIKKKEDEGHVGKATGHHQESGRVLDGEYVDTCTCEAKEKNKGKYLGERVPHDRTCPYGTWRAYTPAEKELAANRIYGRNPDTIRKLINAEQEKVATDGIVQEQNLRNKKTRHLLGMPSKVIPIHKR